MAAAIHYLFKAKLIRFIKGNEIDFIEKVEVFEDENPIIAREKAFIFYQNYVDVLLESKQKKYISDKQARIDLTSFIDSGTSTKHKILESDAEVELSDSLFNGFGVYLVIDKSFMGETVGSEYEIHGIGYTGFNPEALIYGLNLEFSFYQEFGYDIKNYKLSVDYYDDEFEEIENIIILQTPFDWTGYDKPIIEDENADNDDKLEINFEQLIKMGESRQVEFKPSLLYNFSSGKAGISIKAIIAKTICAFLNSNGGFLFIGVNDKGQPQGLDFDYSLSNGKEPKDFFKLEFDEMISHFLSFAINNNIFGLFREIDGKEIFVVIVSPSNNRPVFLKGQAGLEFYVRGEASTQQLKDIEQIANYCIDRWSK